MTALPRSDDGKQRSRATMNLYPSAHGWLSFARKHPGTPGPVHLQFRGKEGTWRQLKPLPQVKEPRICVCVLGARNAGDRLEASLAAVIRAVGSDTHSGAEKNRRVEAHGLLGVTLKPEASGVSDGPDGLGPTTV
jgi:hypothetical protein